MAPGDRDFRLLLAIMKYLGEKRDPFTHMQAHDLIELLPAERRDPEERKNLRMMANYLKFLEGIGYVETGTPTLDGNCFVELTPLGEMFVQPELAQLQNLGLLAEMLDAVEQQILALPMDEAERSGLLFKFRQALLDKAPGFAIELLFAYLKHCYGG